MIIPLHELKRMMEAGTPIRGICAASRYTDSESGQDYISIEDRTEGGGCVTSLFIDDLGTMVDAELFAAMRNALPSLIAVVEAVQALKDEAEIELKQYGDLKVYVSYNASGLGGLTRLMQALAPFQGKEK